MVNSNMKNLKNSKTSIILKRFLLSLFEFDFEKELTLLSQIEKNILILNPTYFQQVKVFIESGVKYHYHNPCIFYCRKTMVETVAVLMVMKVMVNCVHW
jgi:hypothetical protein